MRRHGEVLGSSSFITCTSWRRDAEPSGVGWLVTVDAGRSLPGRLSARGLSPCCCGLGSLPRKGLQAGSGTTKSLVNVRSHQTRGRGGFVFYR